MKKITKALGIVLLCGTLLITYPSVAQTDTVRSETTTTTDDDDDNDDMGKWGLAGLLGLLGLFGLKRNDDVKHRTTVHRDNDDNRTTTTHRTT